MEPEIVSIEELEKRMGHPSILVGVWTDTSEAVELDTKHTERLHTFFRLDESNAFGFGFHGVSVSAKKGRLVINIPKQSSLFYDAGLFCNMLSKAMVRGDVMFEFLCANGTRWGMRVRPRRVYGVIFKKEEGDMILDFAVLEKLKTGMWIKELYQLSSGYYQVKVFWVQDKYERRIHPDTGKQWIKFFGEYDAAEKFFNKIKTARTAKKNLMEMPMEEDKEG